MEAQFENPSPEALLQHAEYLRALARRLVRDPSVAEDLIQETWLSVLERPPLRVAALRPWLAGVLRNLARERVRGEGRRARRELAVAREEGEDAAGDLVVRIESFRALAQDVVELDEPYRSVIVLRYFDQRNAKQIARAQGIPAATVRSRLKRGIEKLRDRMDRRHGGDRSAWCLALAPHLSGSGTSATASVSGLAWKAALAGALVLFMTLIAWRTFESTGADEDDAQLAQGAARSAGAARTAPQAPLSSADAAIVDRLANARAPVELVRGRAIDVHTNRALAGVQIALGAQGERVAQTATDIDGGFALPAHDARELVLEVSAPPGWVALWNTRACTARERAGLDAIELRFEALALLPFSVRLEDPASGAPIADFMLEVRDGRGRIESLTTDALGRVTTTAAFDTGPVVVTLIDHPVLARWRERPRGLRNLKWTKPLIHRAHEPKDEPVLSVAVGPTCRFRWSLPRGLELADLTAIVHATDPTSGEIEARAPVRAGTLPWARFLAEGCALGGAGPWPLELVSADGYWHADALLPRKCGVLDEPLAVEWQACGNLALRVSAPDDAHAAATLELVPQDKPRAALHSALASAHELHALVPGQYRLRVSSPARVTHERMLSISAGETARLDIALGTRASTGAIRGEISTESGGWQGENLQVELVQQDGGLVLSAKPEVELRAGRMSASYSFDELPLGTYELRASATSIYRWSAARQLVKVPDEHVDFVALDRAPSEGFVFKAVDADTGEKISHFQLVFEADLDARCGGTRWVRATTYGALFFNFVPVDAHISWMIAAEGFLFARGGRDARAQDGRIIVRLQRGWERDVLVESEHEHAAIAGATVVLDGRVAGATAHDGRLHVRQAQPPRSIAIVHPDWTLAGGSIDPSNASYETWDVTRIVAYMQRAVAQPAVDPAPADVR